MNYQYSSFTKLDLQSSIQVIANYFLNISPKIYSDFLNVAAHLNIDFESDIILLIVQVLISLDGNFEAIIKFYKFFERIIKLKLPQYN